MLPIQPVSQLIEPDNDETLYLQTVGLLRYVARVGFGVPVDDAEAIVQDTYVAYLIQAVDVKDQRAWLLGTVRNGCRQYWKLHRREIPLPDDSETWADPNAGAANAQLIDDLAASKVIEMLPPRDRDLLERFYLAGESTSTIAEALGTTPGTVQVLLHRSRKRAQALYQGLMQVPS